MKIIASVLLTPVTKSTVANMSLWMVQDAVPEDQMKEEMMESIQKGNFTMRILKDQLQNILKMGPVGQVMGMIHGFANSMMPKVSPPVLFMYISQSSLPDSWLSASEAVCTFMAYATAS